jgi:hypothetical protein
VGSRATTAQALHVYGVVPADTMLGRGTKGIADAEVESVVFGGIAALTSPIDQPDVRTRPHDVLRHSGVLTRALEGGTVLPVQFGTVFESEEAVVSQFLEPRRDELNQLLSALEGRVELQVTAFYVEEAILAEIVRDNRRIANMRGARHSGSDAARFTRRIELANLVATELRSRAERDASAIIDRLRVLAVDYDVDQEPLEHQVLGASFLVDRGRLDDFDAAMNELARREDGRMRFRYVGPLPPQSFVSLEGG